MVSRKQWQAWLAAVAAMIPALGLAQVAVSPAAPAMLDTVRLQVTSSGPVVWDADGTKITMSNNVIDVTLRSGAALDPAPPPRTDEFLLGQFPVGTYTVNVRREDGSTTTALGSTAFTVAAKPHVDDPVPSRDFSDLWWNADQSGWGLNIVQHPSGNLFVTWFAYRGDGQPTWLVVPGGTWSNGRVFQGDVYRTSGPVVGGAFDPSAVKRTLAGHASIVFDGQSPNLGWVTLVVDGVTWNSMITRQPY